MKSRIPRLITCPGTRIGKPGEDKGMTKLVETSVPPGVQGRVQAAVLQAQVLAGLLLVGRGSRPLRMMRPPGFRPPDRCERHRESG